MPPLLHLFGKRLILLLVVASSADGGIVRASGDRTSQATLNDGYSTLYHFCDQEKNLDLLTYVKTTTPEIADYQRRISAAAKADQAIMVKLAQADKGLRLDKVSLPEFELGVRKSMDAERRQQLIFGASGAAYTQAVLMTQSEATNYGLNVAKTLAEQEPDPDRARIVRKMFATWSKFHEEAYRLSR